MRTPTVILTTIVPADVRSELSLLAHRRSLQRGCTVSMNALIREALREHLGLDVPDSESVGRPRRSEQGQAAPGPQPAGATGCKPIGAEA